MTRRTVWNVIALSALVMTLVVAFAPVSATVQALPPRPTPVPTPTLATVSSSQDKGGFLELQAGVLYAGDWTYVQWQDAAGGWHTVDGWQGTAEADGGVVWWVRAADLGKGPFRWCVADQYGGAPLAVSAAFNLPDRAGQRVVVKLQP